MVNPILKYRVKGCDEISWPDGLNPASHSVLNLVTKALMHAHVEMLLLITAESACVLSYSRSLSL